VSGEYSIAPEWLVSRPEQHRHGASYSLE